MSTANLYHTMVDDIPAVSITDKCIVLDLDLTLIMTQEHIESLKEMGILSNPELMSLRNRSYYFTIEDLEKPGIGTKYDFWGITRPHVEEFLIFCFSYFKIVAVWSAGEKLYVEAIVDHLFGNIRPPHIVLTKEDCVKNAAGKLEKPLTKIFESHPVLRRHMSLNNTLILDDNEDTFVHNPNNAIHVPAYQPEENVNAFARDDPSLLQVKYWLLQPEVVASNDVRKLNKDRIFQTSIEAYKNRLRSVPGYRFSS